MLNNILIAFIITFINSIKCHLLGHYFKNETISLFQPLKIKLFFLLSIVKYNLMWCIIERIIFIIYYKNKIGSFYSAVFIVDHFSLQPQAKEKKKHIIFIIKPVIFYRQYF